MDYAFAPAILGDTGLTVRGMYSNRANTTLINEKSGLATLREFIQHLDSSSTVTKPIGDILLASHANSQGFLTTAAMFPGQRVSTSFEILEDTISDTSKSIAIPDSLIGFVTGNPVTHNFHLRGCNIGKATPFLNKMKEALGGNVKLTVSLHFDEFVLNAGYGVWESLFYEFRLIRKTAFGSRADYITALDAAAFKYYDGSLVPLTEWKKLVPAKITKTQLIKVTLPLGVTLKKRSTIDFNRQFRYDNTPYTTSISFSDPTRIPATEADRLAVLKTFLTNKKYRASASTGAFDPAHPYPEYVRWGYTSLQEFLNEHEWTFSIKDENVLVCKGSFHAYTMMFPITDRTAATSGNLLFNFYPAAGSGLSSISQLLETDPVFFATV
jgi:hypothetical protein